MVRILLVSDYKLIFEKMEDLIKGKYKLIWCTYELLEEKQYPCADVVIMHFDADNLEKGLEWIVQIKGRLGHYIPILVLIEGGTPQDIFSMLETGAYDYLETLEEPETYVKKIEDMVSWNWYLKKYRSDKKQ